MRPFLIGASVVVLVVVAVLVFTVRAAERGIEKAMGAGHNNRRGP